MRRCRRRWEPVTETDALVCATDGVAYGALQALCEAGRRVPEEVVVVGFDDLPQSAHVTPLLTSVRHPMDAIGRMAVRLLIERIQAGMEQPEPRTIRIPPRLIPRGSTIGETREAAVAVFQGCISP